MINNELTEAFNSMPKRGINKSKTPAEKDAIKTYGTAAENLLLNKDFALFVHHYKFNKLDELTSIRTHLEQDNIHRVAIAHNIGGIEDFVEWLHNAVRQKNAVVSEQNQTVSPQGPAN